jgi:hypothetical protein
VELHDAQLFGLSRTLRIKQLLGLEGSTNWFDLAAPAGAIVGLSLIFISFRGPKAQADPVAEIVQCGEPFFLGNSTTFADARCPSCPSSGSRRLPPPSWLPCYKLPLVIDPSVLHLLLLAVTGWLDRRERAAIAYLMEENRLLRRQIGERRLRLTDDDRRRLAVRAYRLGREVWRDVATIVTPDTLLRWHRQPVARKWTYARKGSSHRSSLASSVVRVDVWLLSILA